MSNNFSSLSSETANEAKYGQIPETVKEHLRSLETALKWERARRQEYAQWVEALFPFVADLHNPSCGLLSKTGSDTVYKCDCEEGKGFTPDVLRAFVARTPSPASSAVPVEIDP